LDREVEREIFSRGEIEARTGLLRLMHISDNNKQRVAAAEACTSENEHKINKTI
jgi:hypothetical protein